VLLLSLDTVRDSRLPAGEYSFLLLASVAGAVTLAASRDVLTLVVALEVVSLPAFALVALRRFDSRSSEAALKLFLVSVVSTAIMLFGLSLVYGLTGAVHLDRIATALADPDVRSPAAALAVSLAIAGFAFKVAAVPFHFWAPDTYVGAPVPVAAYLSVVSKAAGFVGLAVLLTEGFGPYADVWAPAVAVLAAVTMTVGNLVALRQRHAVRLLAWSSIAQSGYMLVPLGAAGAGEAAIGDVLPATVAYVLAYAVMNLGAFAVVTLVGRHRPANMVEDYRSLGRTEPLTAFALAFALACLAGLPPGLLGLFAKVVVFQAPVEQGVGWLAVVMAVNVVIGLYYYLAWAATLYGRSPDTQAVAARPPSYRISVSDGLAIGITLGAALWLSVLPRMVLEALG
jgi:NADH-quinone oxidoreductase subunit N